jgi:hypothetical protein
MREEDKKRGEKRRGDGTRWKTMEVMEKVYDLSAILQLNIAIFHILKL